MQAARKNAVELNIRVPPSIIESDRITKKGARIDNFISSVRAAGISYCFHQPEGRGYQRNDGRAVAASASMMCADATRFVLESMAPMQRCSFPPCAPCLNCRTRSCPSQQTAVSSFITYANTTELQTFDLPLHAVKIKLIPKFHQVDDFIHVKEVRD